MTEYGVFAMISLFDDYLSRFPVAAAGLVNAVRQKRTAHAYLIAGDRRSTLDGFEQLIAAMAACRDIQENGCPCGVCKSCTMLANGTSPDCITLKPAGRAYMIKIGDPVNPEPNTVRWFMNQLSLSSSEAGAVKIGIIKDVDRLNAEAQNALLKTLEEPPADTVLILSCMHPEKLLSTTRSRCQIVPAVENHVDFDFPEAMELRKLLYRLFTLPDGDVASGAGVCGAVIKLTGELFAGEQERISRENRMLVEQVQENDPALAKRILAQNEDTAIGEYRGKRQLFLGLIYSFFAALVLRSEELPNLDRASESLLEGFVFGRIDRGRALRALEASEELERVLRYNISEEIAWYNWMLKIIVPA